MTLLSLHDLLLRRSDRDLLRTASFDLVQGMRLGIVGANGCGKSTLLSALAGRKRAAEGRVLRPPGVEVAWLGQHVTAPPGSSLWDLAQAELASLQALARELERSLPGAQAGTDAAMRYAELLASFDERGGFTAEARLRAGLERVGLAAERWPVEAHNASGGERQRARLVGVLTSSADVLLLDEPSNHLDLDARAWLAAQLRERRGQLRAVVQRSLGIVRTGADLTAGLAALPDQRPDIDAATDPDALRLALELRAMCDSAQVSLSAALRRDESRGAHLRDDAPDRDDPRWQHPIRVWLSALEGDRPRLQLDPAPATTAATAPATSTPTGADT